MDIRDHHQHEILSETTLRLLMSSQALDLDYHYDIYSYYTLQYMKTLLHYLSNGQTWQTHWILPYPHFWKRSKGLPKAQIIHSFFGKDADDEWNSVSRMINGMFEPTEEAWTTLRGKLMQSMPETEEISTVKALEWGSINSKNESSELGGTAKLKLKGRAQSST